MGDQGEIIVLQIGADHKKTIALFTILTITTTPTTTTTGKTRMIIRGSKYLKLNTNQVEFLANGQKDT